LLLKNGGEFEAAILFHVKTIANILNKNLSAHQPRRVLAAVVLSCTYYFWKSV